MRAKKRVLSGSPFFHPKAAHAVCRSEVEVREEAVPGDGVVRPLQAEEEGRAREQRFIGRAAFGSQKLTSRRARRPRGRRGSRTTADP